MRPGEHAAPATIVIVTVDADPDVLDGMVEHARIGVERFGDCAGYDGGTLHRSADGGRLVQLLRWRSIEAYESCRDDPRWVELPTTAPFLRRLADGSATLDVRTYEVIATSETITTRAADDR